MPVACENRPRPQKKQPLEHGMVDDMQQRPRETQDGDERGMRTHPQEPDSESQRDDADVLHRAVRQQALQVVLGQGEEDSPDPGHDPDADQQPAPPRGCGGKKSQRADQTVDPDLDHHAPT